MNSENRQKELNNSISRLKDDNKTLSSELEATLMALKDNIKEECSQEIKKALQGNVEAPQTNIAEYEKRVQSLISKTNQQMKQVNE